MCARCVSAKVAQVAAALGRTDATDWAATADGLVSAFAATWGPAEECDKGIMTNLALVSGRGGGFCFATY